MSLSANEEGISNSTLMLVAFLVLVGLVSATYAGYRIHHKDAVAKQVDSFARDFISNNKIVKQKLGGLTKVETVGEQRRAEHLPGWYIDYDVIGSHATGKIDMRIIRNKNNDSWKVGLANLDLGQQSMALQ